MKILLTQRGNTIGQLGELLLKLIQSVGDAVSISTTVPQIIFIYTRYLTFLDCRRE